MFDENSGRTVPGVRHRRQFDMRRCRGMPCAAGTRACRPSRQRIPVLLAKDIGDFQPMLVHLWRPSSSERSMGFNSSASKGLRIACSRCMDTRRYLAVVRMSACPSRT